MSAAPVKLRSDLVVSRQGTPEQSVFVIKDPAKERFFRFGETEHFITQQLDGVTSPETVRQRVEERFDAPLPPETLQQFIDRLGRLGLLDQEQRALNGAHSHGRIRGNIFYLRLKAFNPDRLLDRLVTKLKFFFTPAFVWLSALTIFFAACITVANWSEIGRDFGRLYTFSSLVLAYLTMLGVITAHEFAHGLTCKNFGGSVREIGFLLLYFQPAFYCNVSDAWLFPEKSRRLWVTFAGAYFEVFIWALATLVWRVTDPYTLVHYLALVVVATSGIKTTFNLNPLIKLDGYYLLSDYLEVPNLRGRAFAYLGDRARKLWGSSVQRIRNATPRERRIYWIYGLLAWAYSWWVLSIVALYVGGALVRKYQAWGFIGFAVLLAGLFQQPLKKGLRTVSASVRLGPAMGIRTKRLIRLAVLSVLVAALFFFRTELRIAGPFIVLPVHNADVRAEVEGVLQEIYADEGDALNKGDPIAALSDRDYRSELEKVKAEIAEKAAKLKMLKAGARAEEIELARTTVAKGRERVKYAQILLEMEKSLYEDKLSSKKDFETAAEAAALRASELQESEGTLKLLLAGARPEEIEATEAEIVRLQAQQRYLEEQLRLLKVLSPIDGVITTHKLKDRVGEAVKKGDLIAKVHAMKTVTVEIAIPEQEIAEVSLGQKVILKARAYPGTSFQSQVTSIAPVATDPQDARAERTVLVTTQLDNASLLLKPEMTGHAKIYCGQQRLIDLVSRRLIRFIKVEFWSWW